MLKFKKNKGEGQSQCIICSARGKCNIMWHSSSYSLVGYNITYPSHAICRECLVTIAEAFNEDLEMAEELEKRNNNE